MTDLAYLPGIGGVARKPGVLPPSLAGWILPLVLVGVWEAAARAGVVAPNHLPAPSIVAVTILHLAQSGDLASHLTATIGRLGVGFLLGSLAGTIAGALTGASRPIRLLVDPLVQGLRSVPSIAWVPLFILWLGIFEASKVALIAVGVFFPVYLNLMSGIAGVDRKLIEVGRAHRLSPFELIRRVLLPAALPAYIVGLRGGLGLGWMFVAAAELMGASEGLGFLLVDGQQTGRPAVVIAAILLFALLGKLSDLVLARVGRGLTAWQDTEAGR
ncbi:MAG TPA: ABC transporter permease [Aliidongia sp.]|uniref:ABC transporter permease n=1 Tax=Aliidongia sp. TaxID=1914230 RepID=UPI002DDCBE5F|nr:ABC transporter permease [Aliidongia sp.]HEV2675692.1 ABC transporter permease [Aliidongia sp.]